MTKFSIGLILGALAPSAALVYLGGSPLACFLCGAFVALLPVLCFPRRAARALSCITRDSGSVGRQRTARPAQVPRSQNDPEIVSALRNLGCAKDRARRIARQVPDGDFDERLRQALQMARAA